MKSSFRKVVLLSATAVLLGLGANVNAADTTMDTNSPAGTDSSNESKMQPNNPPGPTDQTTATNGVPQQTKTSDMTDTTKPTTTTTDHPSEGTKKHKKHHHHKASTSSTTTNAAPAGSM